jgi:hypothetical protein
VVSGFGSGVNLLHENKERSRVSFFGGYDDPVSLLGAGASERAAGRFQREKLESFDLEVVFFSALD